MNLNDRIQIECLFNRVAIFVFGNAQVINGWPEPILITVDFIGGASFKGEDERSAGGFCIGNKLKVVTHYLIHRGIHAFHRSFGRVSPFYISCLEEYIMNNGNAPDIIATGSSA